MPDRSPIAEPLQAGCYLTTFWLGYGHDWDAERWMSVVRAGLQQAGRGMTYPPESPGARVNARGRRHIYSFFHRFRFGVARDDGPMRAYHALNHPFAGVVLEIWDSAEGADALVRELEAGHVAETMAGTPIGLYVGMEALPFREGMGESSTSLTPPQGLGRRLCLLWFLDEPPQECYSELFQGHVQRLVERTGAGLLLSAPFIPTVPGTDRYVDELRDRIRAACRSRRLRAPDSLIPCLHDALAATNAPSDTLVRANALVESARALLAKYPVPIGA